MLTSTIVYQKLSFYRLDVGPEPENVSAVDMGADVGADIGIVVGGVEMWP